MSRIFTPHSSGPEILFAVRSAALFIYATTRAVYSAQDKLDSFYDHTRKVLLKYGRQAEEQKVSPLAIKDAVKGVFDRILAVLAAKDATREGKTWVSLCEVVLRIASMVRCVPRGGSNISLIFSFVFFRPRTCLWSNACPS